MQRYMLYMDYGQITCAKPFQKLVRTLSRFYTVMQRHAAQPTSFDNPEPARMHSQAKAWTQRWTRAVLK